ncbi:MAG: S8 family serine peptidase [Desulfuromonadales bacterium]|nr:S8 family serine peptidase [Desulfuromonadales bacterium]
MKEFIQPASRLPIFHSTIIALLICYLSLSNGIAFAASKIPQLDEMLRARPTGAPVMAIPAQARIQGTLQTKGTTRVIVRLALPASTTGGFALEAQLDHVATLKQRSRIRQIQNTILTRVAAKRATAAKRYDFIPFMALEVDQTDLQALIASPEIDFIEEDVVVQPLLAQSVPLIGGVNGAFGGYTGSGQTVAILDTGVDKTHPFLTGKVVAEGCYSTTDATESSTAYCISGSTAPGSGLPCPDTATGCYHGTHVAGIVAGKNGPSSAPSGVARDAGLIAVQVFSQFSGSANCGSNATCPRAFSSDLISALQYVYSLRNTFNLASVNMSLGGGQYDSNCDADDPSFKAAVDNLRLAGIATVIASGNNGYTNSISYPACISSAISVGATDKSDAIATYSNSASFLSLLAPGSSITSSYPGGGYATASGTSMATPHVAGAWAVLKSANPVATVTEILGTLVNTGKSVSDSRNSITKSRIQLDQSVLTLLPANGACGSASGQSSTSAPSANLCLHGAASPVTGAGPWNWSCIGQNGGSSASCSADIITYSISASVSGGAGGTVTSSVSAVPYGGSATFTLTPESGYSLTGLTDNGINVSAVAGPPGTLIYSINSVTTDHVVLATFSVTEAAAVPALPPLGLSVTILFGAIFGYGRFLGKRKET